MRKQNKVENIEQCAKQQERAKKVLKDLEDNSKQDNKEEDVTTTFALSDVESDVPAWVSALKNTQNRNKNI